MRKGLFAIKLYELEKSYAHLQSRLELCQSADHAKLKDEINRLRDECSEDAIMLEKAVRCMRTPMAAQLAEAQKNYDHEVQNCLDTVLANEDSLMNEADASALYAEYAIDQATQAMKHALLAAMIALDKQTELKEEVSS